MKDLFSKPLPFDLEESRNGISRQKDIHLEKFKTNYNINQNIRIEETWKQTLSPFFQKPVMAKIKQFLIEERKKYTVFPPMKDIFHAYNQSPFHQLKVVIIGQDPYHGENQAHGLCFSVKKNVAFPPSLKNIFIELQNDLQCQMPTSGDLTAWAKQGVFLLNTTLTVRKGQPNSHKDIGWEEFTDYTIKAISKHKIGIIFLLWGSFAHKKANFIDSQKHYILKAPHPSPYSAHNGFFGCRHFSETNTILKNNNQTPIQWCLT